VHLSHPLKADGDICDRSFLSLSPSPSGDRVRRGLRETQERTKERERENQTSARLLFLSGQGQRKRERKEERRKMFENSSMSSYHFFSKETKKKSKLCKANYNTPFF